MIENKEARPAVGAAEQAEKAAAYDRAAASKSHCTPNPAGGQILISDYLGIGRKNAVHRIYLQKATGYDGRTVRRMIFEERLAGIPILSDCQLGYFLADTQEEKERCVRSMLNRSEEIRRVAQAIEAAEIQHSHNAEQPATGQMQIVGM